MAKISFMRHGEAKYEDISHKKSFKGAHDIKPETLEKLRKQAVVFSNKIDPADDITVWSSPIPRALETANVFIEEIKNKGLKIRTKKIFKVFEEVKGFKWIYLKTLVDGGEIVVDGKTVLVNKKKTNPNNLSYGQYFRNSFYKKLDKETIAELGDFGGIASNIESYESVFKRIFRELERLSKLKKPTDHVLIFTHQCNTDFLVELMNEYKYGGINPGENITLETNGTDFEIIDFPQPIETLLNKEVVKNTKIKFSNILKQI